MADKTKNDQQQKKKEDCSELHSDRESSVESFHTNKSEFSTAAESELIDVDDIELSDEESWLYKSPKKLPVTDKALSTYKWINKEKDNLEVQDTKDALVRKLNQLQTHNDAIGKHSTKENVSSKDVSDIFNGSSSNDQPVLEKSVSCFTSEGSKVCTSKVPSNNQDSEFVKEKENDLLDVHKIAQLQEESLRQSTQRFLDLVEKRSCSDKNSFLDSKFCKPASVEALNVCNGKLDAASYAPVVPMLTMKKQKYFGSSSFLHHQDTHRGSLPNINPGYYSLRSKKSKKSLDQKLSCPLPLSPSHSRLPLNGAGNNVLPSGTQCKLTLPLNDHCESRTLPSSYRIHSRSNSSSRKDLTVLSPSPRRESAPFSSARSSSTTRRDSAPCTGPKYLSPMSSPTLYQRNNGSSSYLQSPSQSRRNPPRDLKTIPPNVEYQRNSSHSPSRRMPLSTVHNCSPKCGNSPTPKRKEDLKGFKVSSKIPSPGTSVRSGIPVPSSYSSRMTSDDESWSHDCY